MSLHRSSAPARRCAPLAIALLLGACADRSPTGPAAAPPQIGPSAAEISLQATPPGYIRIGVVPSSRSIRIGSADAFTVRDKATGDVLVSGENEEVIVSLGEGAVTRTNFRLQVTCTSAAGRDALIARAESHGVVTYTENAGPCWRVMLGEFASNASWSVRSAFRSEMISLGLAGSDSFWKLVTVTEGQTNVIVSQGDVEVVAVNPVVLQATGGRVTINGRPYRGVAEVWTNSGGSLAGINELPLEQYLYGVVPNELPPGPFGEAEAQKAQAVTARTFAIANLGKRRADGFDLLPTTSDQVYRGFASEHPVSTAAVDATAGVVAVADGRLITTLYHSTSGGYTANSEDVFTNAFSYLRGVPDSERGAAFEHVPTLEVFKRAANPTNLRAQAEGDFESDWSRYHRWTVEWTADEMAHVLSTTFATTVSHVSAIRVTDRADHGRVRVIEFETDAGTLRAFKDNIRSRLRYVTSTGSLASLRSTLFFIEPVTDGRTRVVTGWKAYGGGWGHGVGMSQTGAVGMAERGRSYVEILAHYYQGSTVEHRDY
jgi:stage II sporulation protein D